MVKGKTDSLCASSESRLSFVSIKLVPDCYDTLVRMRKQASKQTSKQAIIWFQTLFRTKAKRGSLPHLEKAESGTILTIGQSINQLTNSPKLSMSVADEAFHWINSSYFQATGNRTFSSYASI